jgi:glyceraldehyde-3-phosphate dehydrogenase/erythrose-4-phosphate dehydrogenase
MSIRVVINGFGRVGRCFVRAAHEQDADVEVVGSTTSLERTLADLLRYAADKERIGIDGAHALVAQPADSLAVAGRCP